MGKGIPHGVQRGSGLITEGVRGISTLPIEHYCVHSFHFDFSFSFFFLFPVVSASHFVSLSCLALILVRGTGFCFFPPSRIDVPTLCAGLHARIMGLISIVGVKGRRNAESDESQSNFHGMNGEFKFTCLQGYK